MFDQPSSACLFLGLNFPCKLDIDQQADLENNISNEEIKRAVWDCGVDKSPGPDGFTFGFYRRYWSFLKNDVEEAIFYFIQHGTFPKGGNSSFITLIPKTTDAKMVKDFRLLTLIGVYRQILDGSFISNEVFQWCKKKRKQSMIFKIQSCLILSRGSVIVNGSPTREFQFHRGLKQGDPLSPFLFILIMESLHISVQRVIDTGLFRGVSIGPSLHLSHLFYADDAVFLGYWSDSNIDTIVRVLDCFYRASGLRINMTKRKIIGISVSSDIVDQAASKIGRATLKPPFSYLGSKVGGLMSRIQSWDEITNILAIRLSKWKMKTLSIGGRLTLLKSILGSMPIYHLSLFKASSKVLQRIESIRCHFFIGIETDSKKQTWIKWIKVLASKEKVWHFRTQRSSLWAKVIKGIHGADGKLDMHVNNCHPSIWLDIVREVKKLKNLGIDLLSFIHKKLENGTVTSFWDDVWRGDATFKSLYPRLFALESKGVSLVDIRDRWVWSLEGSGEFFVASVSRVIDDCSLPVVLSKTKWVNVVPIKVNIHAWKVRLDRLSTRLNISKRNMNIESILCPLCNNAVESSSHIFFACHIARELFRKITRWWDINFLEISSHEDWTKWLSNLRLHSKHKKLLEGVCYVMWWHIWNFRNKSIFGAVTPSKASIFEDIVASSFH
ncbi:RNA-directed DNA polymerase, eukaryota, reverse transcriptase zinc-binding domain protein, partial [Tanacetum coccineum]